MKIRCSDIKYDTDEHEIELPTELEVEVENNTDEEVADAISEKTGWLVLSFNKEVR